jgi:plastocyanin
MREKTMKKRKREILIVLCLIGGAILFKVGLSLVTAPLNSQPRAGDVSTLPVQHGHVQILISQRGYHAATVVVTTGTTITWSNRDPMAHTVTQGNKGAATARGFHSPVLSTGQSWSYTFQTPGTHLYTCIFHPDMNGRVIVKATTT